MLLKGLLVMLSMLVYVAEHVKSRSKIIWGMSHGAPAVRTWSPIRAGTIADHGGGATQG